MPQIITGSVSSDKSDKTITVTVATRKTHPIYRKQYTVNTKFLAHDPENQAKVGDRVQIVAIRPMSARKHFQLDKILEKAEIRFEESDATADIPEVKPVADSDSQVAKKPKKSTLTANSKPPTASASKGSAA